MRWEFFLFLYLPVGTYLLNQWRTRIKRRTRIGATKYVCASLVLAVVPITIVARLAETEQSALGVVLAVIALFWFSIVGSRFDKNLDAEG